MERFTIFERVYELETGGSVVTCRFSCRRDEVKNRDEVIRMANKMISDFQWKNSVLRLEYDVILTHENLEDEIIHTVERTSE